VTRYARPAPSSAAATDAGSSKSATATAVPSGSRAASPRARTMARTAAPRLVSAATRAWPVLPVAPVTRIGLEAGSIVIISLAEVVLALVTISNT
jgi:hypothetical protein